MAFTDLKELEAHLATRSYIDGYTPSQSDVGVYTSLGSAPDAKQYPHAARWYKHIASYAAEHASLPGDKDAASKLYAAGPSSAPAAPAAAAEEEDDEIDLFGSDDEVDEEAEKLKAQRLKEYEEKKAKKGAKPAAKSIVTLEVKPWDDETDMAELEKAVRGIDMSGLVWGGSQLVAIGYGIKKLQINCVVEDELVSVDELQEKIADFEDYVQSSDVAAMQKL